MAFRRIDRASPIIIAARRIVADVKALARECGPEAIETLKTIMLDGKSPPAARISAATSLLDRGYGTSKQTIDITTIIASLDLSKLSDDQLYQLDALIALTDGSVIDQSGERVGVD